MYRLFLWVSNLGNNREFTNITQRYMYQDTRTCTARFKHGIYESKGKCNIQLSLLACFHLIGPVFKLLLLAQRWPYNYAPTVWVVGPMTVHQMLADCSRVIFLKIKCILILQQLYNLLLDENSAILFYNNNFSIYLIILSDFDDLKLDKILDCFVQPLSMFCKSLWLHIKC